MDNAETLSQKQGISGLMLMQQLSLNREYILLFKFMFNFFNYKNQNTIGAKEIVYRLKQLGFLDQNSDSKKLTTQLRKILKKLSSTGESQIDFQEFIGIASDLRTPFIKYMSKKAISWGKGTYDDLIKEPQTKRFTQKVVGELFMDAFLVMVEDHQYAEHFRQNFMSIVVKNKQLFHQLLTMVFQYIDENENQVISTDEARNIYMAPWIQIGASNEKQINNQGEKSLKKSAFFYCFQKNKNSDVVSWNSDVKPKISKIRKQIKSFLKMASNSRVNQKSEKIVKNQYKKYSEAFQNYHEYL